MDYQADYRAELHDCGVHVKCKNTGPLELRCKLAGQVERFHAHSYDGPLVCGCDDWGTSEYSVLS